MSTAGAAQRGKFETTTLKIGNHDFVAGLQWKSLRKLNAYMKEAREYGKANGMDIVSIRKGVRFQGGFVKKNASIVKGMYSLAHAVAGQFEDESWIAAFALPDGRYGLVAGRAGLILPGCDVVGTRQEIYEFYREKCNSVNFQFAGRYIPDDFNDGGTPVDVEDLLSPKRLRKEYKLRPLFFGLSNKELMGIGALALVVAVAAGGALKWKQHLDHQAAIAEAQRVLEQQRLMEELERAKGEKQSREALKHPWTTMPSAGSFLDACQSTTNNLPLAMGGWLFESVHCTDAAGSQQAEITYVRAGNSTINDFRDALGKYLPATPAFGSDGNRVLIALPLQTVMGGDDAVLIQTEAIAEFGSFMQRLGIQAQIEIIPYVPPKPPENPLLPGQQATQGQQQAAPDWIDNQWSIQSQLPPERLLAPLELPGLRYTEITVNRTDAELTWEIKGKLYAR